MKNKAVLLFILVLSCKHTAPVDGGTSTIPGTLVNCAVEATKNAAINIIPDVTTILTTGQWEAGLIQLVVKWGEDAVNCAVYHVTLDSREAARNTPGDDLAKARTDHGTQWLAKRGISL